MNFGINYLQSLANKYDLEVSTVKCLSLIYDSEEELIEECQTIGTEDFEDEEEIECL